MAIQPIRITISGIDKFSSTIAQSQKKIEQFGKNVSMVGRRMTMGLTLPIIALGVSSIQTATSFEKSMNKVEALTQASADGMLQMRNQAKKLGIETQFTASQAADAMGFLGMAGWKTNQILKGTPALLHLAAAAETDLARTADIASNIMGAFQISADKTSGVTDILAATTASSNVNLEMLAESFKDAGPIARAAGASLKDTAVAIGFLGNVGIQGSKSGTALKNMFIELAVPGGKATKILDHFGIKTRDMAGNLLPYADILKDLAGKMGDLGSADKLDILNTLFGKRMIAGAAALTSDMKGVNSGFRELSNALDNVEGRAQAMAETMMKGAPGAFKRMQSAWEGLMISISESGLLDYVTKIIEKVAIFTRKLANVNPAILKMVTIFAAVAAVIGPLLMVIGPLITAFGTVTGAIASAGGVIALLSNPIGWVVAAIMALIGVIVAMKMKFGFSLKEIGMGILALTGPIGWIAIFFINKWKKILPFIKLIGALFLVLGKVILYALWPVFKFLEMLGKLVGWIADKILDLLTVLTKLVLPKWLEEKLGFSSPEGTPPLSAAEIAGRAGAVNKNENETKITIEDKAGVKLRAETQSGTLDTEVIRGLGFAGAF